MMEGGGLSGSCIVVVTPRFKLGNTSGRIEDVSVGGVVSTEASDEEVVDKPGWLVLELKNVAANWDTLFLMVLAKEDVCLAIG